MINSPLPAPISISTGARRPKITGRSITKTRGSDLIRTRSPISRALGLPQTRAAFRSLAMNAHDDTGRRGSSATVGGGLQGQPALVLISFPLQFPRPLSGEG